MNTRLILVIALAAGAIAVAGWSTHRSFGGARGEIISAQRAAFGPEALAARAAERAAGNATAAMDTPTPGAPASADAGSDSGSEPITPRERAARMPPQPPAGGRRAPNWATEDPYRAIETFTFPRVGDPAEADAAFETALSAFEARGPADSGNPTPNGGWSRAIDAWQSFLRPLIAEDPAAFAAVVERMGGQAPEADEDDPDAEPRLAGAGLFGRLTPFIAGAPMDLDASKIGRLDPRDPRAVPRLPRLPAGMELPAGAVPMMENRNQMTNAEGVTTEDVAISLPLAGLFPRTTALLDRGSHVVEVWTPALLPGGKGDRPDYTFTAIMVRDPSVNAWVPAALRLRLISDEAKELMPSRSRG
ncbi:MAG: hypothetical protein AAF138_10890 [Planctomycetota bacterium]